MRPIFFILLFYNILSAQPHPAWRHYTLNEGLPNNTVYGMCEDSIGRLYFATETGICRFDGYRFERFPGPEEINAVSVFCPQADSLGRVWFRTIADRLYFIENDSIHPWKWNALLAKYPSGLSPEFSFWENNSIVLRRVGWGFLRIYSDGRVEEWKSDENYTQWALLPGMSKRFSTGNRGLMKRSEIDRHYKLVKRDQPYQLHLPHTQIEEIPSLPLFYAEREPYDKGLEIAPHHYIFISQYEICETQSGQVLRHVRFDLSKGPGTIPFIQKLSDGRILMARIENQAGLWMYKNVDRFLAQKPDTVLLRGEETTMMHVDRDSGIWVTTLQNGIFYLPNSHISIYGKVAGLSAENVCNIVSGQPGQLFFSTSDQNLYQLDARRDRIQKMKRAQSGNRVIRFLVYEPIRSKLIVGAGTLYFFENQTWREYEKNNKTGYNSRITSNRLLITHDGHFFYNLGSRGISKINAFDDSFVFDILQDFRFSALTQNPEGKIWLAKNNGLHELVSDSMLQPVSNRPEALCQRIRQMGWTSDGILVAATASNGVCFWMPPTDTQQPNNGWFKTVSSLEGMTSELVSCIALQGDSIVWAGGNAGLNKITGWRPGETLLVEQITISHGLPSNQINGLCIADGILWVATSGGLVRLDNMPQKTGSRLPFLAEILSNNQKCYASGNGIAQFPSTENNLEFRFYTLNFRQNGHILYRFRLNKKSKWQESSSTSARFSALAPGHYRFEVQSQNEDKIWSESTIFPFVIRPPWWADWPFKTTILFVFLGSIFMLYKWQMRRLKSKFEIQNQLAALEQTALRAQMNPHFIANCLSSLQRLVLEQKNEAAIVYIARFAKLARAALEFSGRPEITLEEDLAYLENYLALEKLRYKDKFEFSITIDSSINAAETYIPPMLTQPLCENAIHHAFFKMDRGGKLEIRTFCEQNVLSIEVSDNGEGISDGARVGKDGAHALPIIRKRLNLLGRTGSNIRFNIENRRDGVSGTCAGIYLEMVGASNRSASRFAKP